MYYNLKIKKLSAILASIIVTLSTISLSSFASAPTGESDNTPSISSPASEQTVNSSSQAKLIKIDQPGTYRLVGVGVGNLNFDNPNTILVKTTDRVVVNGPGEYNITLDNVNIDIDSYVKGLPVYPITVNKKDAVVNLFLEGKNILKNKLDNAKGIYSNGSLKIAGINENSYLNVSGYQCSIESQGNIEILSGNIVSEGQTAGIAVTNDADLIIKGGNITSTAGDNALFVSQGKIIISGGEITEKTTWSSQLGDIIENISNGENVLDANGKIIAHIGKNYNITGGTINGVSFPITGSFESAALDKELSNNDNVTSEKSASSVSSTKTPNTGKASEVNTFLICTLLSLALTAGVSLNRLKASK